MDKINYDLKMQDIISNLTSKKTLLLHVCCAPCSSAVIKRLNQYFDITIYFYNPNIDTIEEYNKRYEELINFVKKENIKVINEIYEPTLFEQSIEEYKHLKEGSMRCFKCYELRLDKSAKYASENKFDFYTTTLSISPYKNSVWLNQIGKKLSEKYKIDYLYADFKKNNGYKESIELSRMHNLYRQDYCGCIYSLNEAIERKSK